MEERKEIKWKRTGRAMMEGRQDGVLFTIFRDKRRAEKDLPAYFVGATDTKNKGRNIDTRGQLYFSLEGAKEFCQKIMAKEIELDPLREQIREKREAEAIEKEKRAIRQAVAEAKEFRAHLERAGISYTALLDLEEKREELSSLAHNTLLGFEHGEGWPDGT